MKRIFLLVTAAAVMVAMMAGAAWAASPSNVSLTFLKENPECSCAQETTTLKAGDQLGYQVGFTTQSALSDQANDTITISAPAGTVFPASRFRYQINAGSAGYSVLSNPVLSNNGATVTVPLAGNDIDIPAGTRVAVLVGIFDEHVTNPTTPGNYTMSVATSKDSTPASSSSYTIIANDPSKVTVADGGDQQTQVGEAFATPLSAKVTDDYGNAISGQEVTFTAPSSGPSGTFASSSSTTDTATTGTDGTATASAFTANTSAGSYEVQASSGSLQTAKFSLTNSPGPAVSVSVSLDPQSIAADGSSTTQATATVKDAHDNGVPGDDVSLTSSDGSQQIGTSTDNGDGTYTATITSSTTPGDSTITAADRSVTPNISGTASLSQFVPPKVKSMTPTKKKVSAKGATVTATFSEAMDKTSVEAEGTFTLKKKGKNGSTQAVQATVTYDPATDKATLTPTSKLRSGTYKVEVTSAAKNLVGRALDQDLNISDNQSATWSFKVG